MNDEKGVSESWRKTTMAEIQLNWWLDWQIDRDKDREGEREREKERQLYWQYTATHLSMVVQHSILTHLSRICRSNSVLVKYKIQLYKKVRSEAGKWGGKKIPKEITCIFERAGRKEENRVPQRLPYQKAAWSLEQTSAHLPAQADQITLSSAQVKRHFSFNKHQTINRDTSQTRVFV